MHKPNLAQISLDQPHLMLAVLTSAEISSQLYVAVHIVEGEAIYMASTRPPCEHMRERAMAVFHYSERECARAARILHRRTEMEVPSDLLQSIHDGVPRIRVYVARSEDMPSIEAGGTLH